MADRKVWTAAELEQLSFAERQRIFDEGVVTDLSQLPPEFLERVRAKGHELAKERGLLPPPGDAG